jgi:hypothetical protein
MSYEKDKLDSFVTSASLSTALAPYITSASVSSAIAGINLAPYVTSNSLSAAVATDTLTVRGHAGVSATLSAAAVTVAGRPVGAVLLGYQSGTAASSFGVSGSWSDICIIQVSSYVANGGGFMPIRFFTDGGTTAILESPLPASVGVAQSIYHDVRLYGGNGDPSKMAARTSWTIGETQYGDHTTTANTGFINCVKMQISVTASYAFIAVYGWRAS